MYGLHDAYNSPQQGNQPAPQLGTVFGLIEAEFGMDDDDFGFLGIAIGKKARTKKHEKRIARILGKLKTLVDQKKMDKVKKHAGKLARSIRILSKVSPDWEETPEIEAYVSFAEDGDQEALLEALGEVSIGTGDEMESAPRTVSAARGRAPAYAQPLYRTSGSGARGAVSRSRAPQRQRLPPGFRPRDYTRWRRNRKLDWLSRHPNAASARHFADPRSWARPGIRPAAARARGTRRYAASMERPGQRADRYRWNVGRRRGGRGGQSGGQQTQTQTRAPARRTPVQNLPHQGRGGAFRAGRAVGRNRYGEFDEEMGALSLASPPIGISAFNNIDDPTGFTRENTLIAAIGNEAAGTIETFGMEFDDEDMFGGRKKKAQRQAKKAAIAQAKADLSAAKASKVKTYGAWYGDDDDDDEDFGGRTKEGEKYAPWVRKLDAKLGASKRKYERAISIGNTTDADRWLKEYQRIASLQTQMRAKPELQVIQQARALEQLGTQATLPDFSIYSTSTAGQDAVAQGLRGGSDADFLATASDLPDDIDE